MPSHKNFNKEDIGVVIPKVLFELLSVVRIQPLDSMILHHITVHSLNFHRNSHGRSWVKFSSSEFANETGFVKRGVYEAINRLLESEILEYQDAIINYQKGREYRIASNKKLNELYSLHKKKGVRPHFTPKNVDKSIGVRPQFIPSEATLHTQRGQASHLVRPCYTPWGVNTQKSLENLESKLLLNTYLNNFLNKFSEFENSFLELYLFEANSQASKYKIKNQIIALIRRYGRFSTFIAMYVNLFSESSQIVDFDALNAFLISNEIKLKEQESKLKEQCDKLYFKLQSLMDQQDISQDLEILHENFRQNASVLLIGEELEQSSSEIFLYSSFHKDVMSAFDTCNYKFERFTNELLGKINLYCEFKILGMKEGLNYVQSAN